VAWVAELTDNVRVEWEIKLVTQCFANYNATAYEREDQGVFGILIFC